MQTIYTKQCPGCSKTFTVAAKNCGKSRKYCSHACYASTKRKAVGQDKTALHCQECGKLFYDRPSHAPQRKYCSRTCKEAKQGVRASMMLRQIPDRPCVVCGTIFRPSQRASYGRPIECCSTECANIKKRKHQREDITHCQICNKALTTRQISNMNKYCSRACMGKANAQWHADPEHKEFMRQHGAKCALQGQQAPTKIELRMADALDEAGIDYVYQFPVGNLYGTVFVCDFAIRDTMVVIECDGDYWHSLPDVQAKDKRKDKYLRKCGYTVLHFSETQINQDVEQCVHIIQSHL